MVDQKILTYGFGAVAILGFFLSLMNAASQAPNQLFGAIGAILSTLSALLAILFLKFGYVVMPLVTKTTKTTVTFERPYEIPPSQDVIIREINGIYYASIFLGLKIFESATEKSPDQNMAYNEHFERAISNLKYVTKISYLLFVEDISEKRKTLETRRAEAQLRLQREREKGEADVLRLDKYEKEVSMFEGQINKLIRGEKPIGVLATAMTCAVGVSKDAAVANVKAQANELTTVISNALNVEVEILTADQMLKAFEWEAFFPPNPHELESNLV